MNTYTKFADLEIRVREHYGSRSPGKQLGMRGAIEEVEASPAPIQGRSVRSENPTKPLAGTHMPMNIRLRPVGVRKVRLEPAFISRKTAVALGFVLMACFAGVPDSARAQEQPFLTTPTAVSPMTTTMQPTPSSGEANQALMSQMINQRQLEAGASAAQSPLVPLTLQTQGEAFRFNPGFEHNDFHPQMLGHK